MKTDKSNRPKTRFIYTIAVLLMTGLTWTVRGQPTLSESIGSPGFSHSSAPKSPLTPRALTPDDLNRMSQIGDQLNPFSFSPDGMDLAFVFVRPVTTSRLWPQNYLFGGDRSDVWVTTAQGGKPANITHGEKDGSGYFMPSWSPDGKKLAMLSTRGGNLRLWLWDKTSRQLRMLSDRAIDLRSWDPPFTWVSADKIIYYAMPGNQTPTLLDQDLKAQRLATLEWDKARKGLESTSSVIESGVPFKLENRPQDKLTMLDVASGKTKEIATGTFRFLKLSPTKSHIAFLKQTSVFQNPPASLTSRSLNRFAFMGYQLMIADTQGNLLTGPVQEVNHVYSLDWSSDGQQLALVGEKPGAKDDHPNVYLYQLATHSIRNVFENTLDPPAIMWSTANELLVRTDRKIKGNTEELNKRVDWWLISPNQPPRNLTSELKRAPLQLFEQPGGVFVGQVSGDLWRLAMDETPPKKMNVGLDGQITAVIWPNRPAAKQIPVTKLVVETRNGVRTSYYLIDLLSDRKSPLSKPDEAATLVYYNPQSDVAVMTANTRSGTFLWLCGANSQQAVLLVETNTFLREIAEGERKQIEYRSLDGRTLKAWLILPIHYQKPNRYPLITWVRAGSTQGDVPPLQTNLNIPMPFTQYNLQLLAAHGYAVLLPSMPIREGALEDKLVDLTGGVLPAVDKVIEMGIADPHRLGVIGHSFGGSTTYGLITQTDRFQAAIAMAGHSETPGSYGQFEARQRYSDFPQEHLFANMYIAESPDYGYGLVVPPWADLQRYIRNSPLFHADRVQTPLMIIHGDMDSAVPIQQGEVFFSALYRQNKRARFVRYWGEGHAMQSPANIRDMWKQIYAWFDEFLMR